MTSTTGANDLRTSGDPISSLHEDTHLLSGNQNEGEVRDGANSDFVDVGPGTDPTLVDPVTVDVEALIDSKLHETPVVGNVSTASIIAPKEKIAVGAGSIVRDPDAVVGASVCEASLAVGESAVDVVLGVAPPSADANAQCTVPPATEAPDATGNGEAEAGIGHESQVSVPDVSETIVVDLAAAGHSPTVNDSHDAAAVVEAAIAAIEMPQQVVPVAQIVDGAQSLEVSGQGEQAAQEPLADPSRPMETGAHEPNHREAGMGSSNPLTAYGATTVRQEENGDGDAAASHTVHASDHSGGTDSGAQPASHRVEDAVREASAAVETSSHPAHCSEVLPGHESAQAVSVVANAEMMEVEPSPASNSQCPAEGAVADSTSVGPEPDDSKVKQEGGASSGIVHFPSPNDVLSGRGASVNVHPGNRHFRSLCQERKTDFDAANHATKRRIATEIVRIVTGLDPPGRFLRKTTLNPGQEVWLEVNNEKAIQKACQVMRDLHRPDRIALREIAAAERKRRKTMGDVPQAPTPAKKRKIDDVPVIADGKASVVTTPKAEADVSLGDTNTSAPVRESFAPAVPKEDTPPPPLPPPAEEENVVMADGVPAGCDNGVVPTANDVLAGRGAFVNTHPGNVRFRHLALERKDAFDAGTYADKRALAAEVVRIVRSLEPSGRFLRRVPGAKPAKPVAVDSDGTSFLLPPRGLEGPWEELGDEKSVHKACQVMRDLRRPDRVGGADRFLVTSPELLRSSVGNGAGAEDAVANVKEEGGGVAPMETSPTDGVHVVNVGEVPTGILAHSEGITNPGGSVSIVDTGDAGNVSVQEAEVAAAAAAAAAATAAADVPEVPLNDQAVASAAAAAAVAAAAVAESPSVSTNEAEAAAAAAVAALDGGSSTATDATAAAAAAAAAVAVAILPESEVGTGAPVSTMESSETEPPDNSVMATMPGAQLQSSLEETTTGNTEAARHLMMTTPNTAPTSASV